MLIKKLKNNNNNKNTSMDFWKVMRLAETRRRRTQAIAKCFAFYAKAAIQYDSFTGLL